MRNFITCLFLLQLAFCNVAVSQEAGTSSLDSFSGKFITAIRTHEKQRAYLVTDKSFFAAGETIWFRAFLLNTGSQKINTKSRFLFVDIINEKDSVLKLLILDAAKQQLSSRIVLPDSMPAGYYWLRAYTRQMVDTYMSGIDVKPIYIAAKNNDNRFTEIKKKNSIVDSSLLTTFFPEGGTLMTGINTTTAVRTSNKNGMAVSITGYIKDNRDTIVANFTTNSNGLGKFDFEPSRYRQYKAVINWHGKDISYPLPPFNFFAGQLSVTKITGGYKLRILLEDSIYKKGFETYVIGVSRDSLIFAGIGKGLYEVVVDKQKLPAGIATFYLFDKNFKLLSERSIYAQNSDIQVNASTDKNIYGKKDKVTLNISIKDAAQLPVPALVSVSVTDILAHFPEKQPAFNGMLSDEESADNLFMALDQSITDEEADLLMLVKKNTYQTLSQNISSIAGANTDSLLYIKGTALNNKNEPSANSVLTLFSNSGDAVLYTDTTTGKGRFRFPVDYYADSTQFAIESGDKNGNSNVGSINTDAMNYPAFKTPAFLKKYLSLTTAEAKKYFNTYRDDEQDKQMLPRVTVRSKKKVNYDESKRKSAFSNIITTDNLREGDKLGTAVLSVAGMHLINGMLVVNGLTSMNAPNAGSEPMLLVEGVQVAASPEPGEASPVLGYLNSLAPKDVDFIEVLKGAEAANYGMNGGNGVILVNLLNKRRDLKGDNNLKIFYAKGVSAPVLFTGTSYQKQDAKTPVPADKRSTLFWNGNLLSDNVHNTTLTFYTGDVPATYKATITGVTIHGDIIFKTITFQSK